MPRFGNMSGAFNSESFVCSAVRFPLSRERFRAGVYVCASSRYRDLDPRSQETNQSLNVAIEYSMLATESRCTYFAWLQSMLECCFEILSRRREQLKSPSTLRAADQEGR